MSPPSPTLAIFTPDQRRVIELLALGWSTGDVARITDTSAWNVRNHITRAGRRLPDTFFPDLVGVYNARARLLMYYAVAIQHDQLALVA